MNTDSFFFNTIFPILVITAMILWFYCLWFLNKYDKNTNRLILLLILNVYYVPFYFPIIKKIRKENRIKGLSEEMYDVEFIEMSRRSIIESLELWASKTMQADFLENENNNSIHELFLQWESVFRIDNKIIEEAFNESEKKLLFIFDKSIRTCSEKYRDGFPVIIEFQKTNDWKVLNKLAIEIQKEIQAKEID